MDVEEMLERKFKETTMKAIGVHRFNTKLKEGTMRWNEADNSWFQKAIKEKCF